jgi:hypothetical protein
VVVLELREFSAPFKSSGDSFTAWADGIDLLFTAWADGMDAAVALRGLMVLIHVVMVFLIGGGGVNK